MHFGTPPHKPNVYCMLNVAVPCRLPALMMVFALRWAGPFARGSIPYILRWYRWRRRYLNLIEEGDTRAYLQQVRLISLRSF
jgi:hypothetical protein